MWCVDDIVMNAIDFNHDHDMYDVMTSEMMVSSDGVYILSQAILE